MSRAPKPILPESLEQRGGTSDPARMEPPDLAGDVTGARGAAEVALHLSDPSAARREQAQATQQSTAEATDEVFHTGDPSVGLPAWFVHQMTPSKLKDVLTAVLNAMHFRRRGHEGKFHSVPLLPDARAAEEHP